jgi:hypothetical protein
LLQALCDASSNFTGIYIAGFGKKYGGYPGVETPLTPDGPGDSTLVMLCKVLGYMAGDGFVEVL